MQHSASLSSGSSGGPLVSQDGSVVAINRGGVNQYYYSVAISQIREVLDKLGVEYTEQKNLKKQKQYRNRKQKNRA